VGDIYGTDYSKLGLKATKIASSFGKVFKKGVHQSQDDFNPGDIAKSLLFMVR
jgi:type II pantothenate kinase